MRINHNISALNTYRQLSANNTATSSSLEKLSSGLRINRAGDDAAGLAISEKMRGQIRGLDQASSNANDGISLIQTAEGALNETHSILQRMRELAVQSANDTNTDADRVEIQKEIDQLSSEITRISTDTQFNTKNLIDGSMQATASINRNELPELQMKDVSVAAGATLETGNYEVTISNYTAAQDRVDASNVTVDGTYTGKHDASFTYKEANSVTGDKAGWYDDKTGNAVSNADFSRMGLTVGGTAQAGANIKVTAGVTKLGQAGTVEIDSVGGTNSKGLTAVMEKSISASFPSGTISPTATQYGNYATAVGGAPSDVDYGETQKSTQVQFRLDSAGKWDVYKADPTAASGWTATAVVDKTDADLQTMYGITLYGEGTRGSDAAGANADGTIITVNVTGNVKANPGSVAAVDASVTTAETKTTAIQTPMAAGSGTNAVTNNGTGSYFKTSAAPTVDPAKFQNALIAADALPTKDYGESLTAAGLEYTFTYDKASASWDLKQGSTAIATGISTEDVKNVYGVTTTADDGKNENDLSTGSTITVYMKEAQLKETTVMALETGDGQGQEELFAKLEGAGVMPSAVEGGTSQNVANLVVTASKDGSSSPRFSVSVDGQEIASGLTEEKMKDFGLKFVSSAKVNDGDTYTMKVLGGSRAKDAEIASTVKITQSEEVAAKEATYTTSITASNGEKMSSSALKFDFGEGFGMDEDGNAVASTSFNVNVDASNALVFHIGANSGQNTTLNMNNMNSSSLGVDNLDLTTQKGADAAITTIDNAITTVSAQRSALGAMQNRLEHTINNLSTTSENLTASESQIRDVDMAKEMTSFTKNNILVQAAQAMLAQANQQPQGVLSLLR